MITLFLALSRGMERAVSAITARALYYLVVVPTAWFTPRESREGWQAPTHADAHSHTPPEAGLLAELIDLLRTRRRLWMLPILLLVFLLGGLLLLTEGAALVPFVYPLF